VSVTILFVLVVAGLAGWWLFARHLTARPWEADQRRVDDLHDGAAVMTAPSRVALWVLLAVITSFFGLFMSAYGMRMMLADWRPLAEPGLLWINTLILILASLAFQWTRGAAQEGNAPGVVSGLAASGFFTCAFLVGQLLAFRDLNAAGQFMTSNAANAFFYLLTCLHGLHLVGGLVAWGRTVARVWRGNSRIGEIRVSVELCTVYWHYLLLVWLVLFGLLLTT
jgi:cytochrome c oxidase subunit 3